METAPAGGARSSRVFDQWFGKFTTRVAWLGLILAVALPPQGIGLSLCWMRGHFDVPCPGCGLTRSLSCAARGLFYESWQFHPFGPLIFALFLAVAVVSLLAESRRIRLSDAMNRRTRLLRVLSLIFVIGFCAYGFARALLQLAGICQFRA